MRTPRRTGGPSVMLAPFRTLDLTDETGALCGRILADLGCEVIKIEPPGGDPARLTGPFLGAQPNPAQSLYWWAYNANKKGVTLDLASSRGRDIFRLLAAKADFVIESFAPGSLDRLGLGYGALSELNRRIIVTSITPFGQTGPYKDFRGSDIVCLAMSGLMHLVGDPDRPPVRITAEQAYLYGGAEAASATLAAHYHRESSGQGQHVDVSTQESIAWTLGHDSRLYEINGIVGRRRGRGVQGGRITRSYIFPCKDGYVAFLIQPGVIGAKTMAALVEWMAEQGAAGELEHTDWDAVDLFTITQREIDRMEGAFTAFFQTKSKAELFKEGVRRRFLVYPVNGPRELFKYEHLKARDFFVDLEQPELGRSVKYPGPWFRSTEAPWRLGRRAPLPGEDNVQIYRHLAGLTEREVGALEREGVI